MREWKWKPEWKDWVQKTAIATLCNSLQRSIARNQLIHDVVSKTDETMAICHTLYPTSHRMALGSSTYPSRGHGS